MTNPRGESEGETGASSPMLHYPSSSNDLASVNDLGTQENVNNEPSSQLQSQLLSDGASQPLLSSSSVHPPSFLHHPQQTPPLTLTDLPSSSHATGGGAWSSHLLETPQQ